MSENPIAGSAGEAQFLFDLADFELDVAGFSAMEAVSSLFEVNLNLASEDEVSFSEVVGQPALLTITGQDVDRYFHGILNEFIQTGTKGRHYIYQASLVPSLWLLSLQQDCRIFQQATVPDIVRQVLEDTGITGENFEFRLQGSYETREYCVQYRETALQFISRLLEEEGIFYFFEHARDKHLLVFGDSTANYQPIPGNQTVLYSEPDDMVPGEEFVFQFSLSRKMCSGSASYNDFNFKKPGLNLNANETAESFNQFDIYDYPGKYQDENRGRALTRVRLQEQVMSVDTAEGQSDCPRFLPGLSFELSEYPLDAVNQEYLLMEISHSGSQPQVFREQASMEGHSYDNHFSCVPSRVTVRPKRVTPKPLVEGVQTAIVCGPDGEEIYTDEYGRVKVRFHWDRQSEGDERSSCWIRVASSFAGGGYGAIFTPRIGQEVIVDFLEGDPDRPIITGRVYNADNPVPYTLPDEKTKSTIKSNSSLGGEGFNEIRFEDRKGEEQLFLRAEKDLEFRTQNDRKEIVQNESHVIVQVDQVEKVEGDKHLTVSGDQNERVDGTVSMEAGQDLQEKVGGKHALDAAQEIHLKAGMKIIIEGGVQISLKVGGNFVDIGPAGVSIQGTMVNINSGGSPGSGSGCSPQAPREPLEADEAQAGADPDVSAVQAQALQSAAQTGTPFCEQCQEAARRSGAPGGS